MPDAKEVADGDDDDDIGSLLAEESEPSPSSAGTSPEPVRKSKPKSSLSKFTASSPASSAPSTPKYTPRGSVGAFGKPTDKGERVKKFVETNKDRYSWLSDIRDKEGNRPGEEKYDPRTLYIPPGAWKTFTAFEKQYWEVKQNLWDTMLFFQKGKFFELYENDATIGNQQFDLKMTDRTNMRYIQSLYVLLMTEWLVFPNHISRIGRHNSLRRDTKSPKHHNQKTKSPKKCVKKQKPRQRRKTSFVEN